jgi:hypothetical protein
MEFIRAQKNIQLSKPSLAAPKRKQGIKLKSLQLQSDLIFVRRGDLIQANKKFGNDESLKKETYIITTVEAASGLTRLTYLTSKDKTNDALEKHIHWFANRFDVKPSSLQLRTDAGTEYSMERLKKTCPDYKFVPSASSCERKNRQVQANFFRLLKNRQARTIRGALKKAETLCNNTIARKHKKTPLELIEEKTSNKDILDNHNKSRKEFKKGDNRGDFKVGDYVRVQAPDKKRRGIGYKTYKQVGFEKAVHKIIKTTTRAKVKKYRLDDKRWLTQDRLLLAKPTDKESQKLIKDRDEEEEKELAVHRKDLKEYQAAVDVVKAAEEKEGTAQMVTRRGAAIKGLKKLAEQRKKLKQLDEAIEEGKRVKPKAIDRNVPRKAVPLVAEFKKLVDWTEGEQDKSYAGSNEQELTVKYNKKITRGKEIAKQLRKDKVRMKGYSVNYFKQYQL